MPRIPYFDMANTSAELRETLKSRPPLNIYRMLSHSGPAALGFLKLGAALLRENQLDSRLRELAILRVGILCRAGYEVFQHKRVARNVGVSEEKIAALEDGPDHPIFENIERKVLRYTDQVVFNVKAGDSTFNALAQVLSHRELTELTITIGYYMMVSRFLENFEVEIEEKPVV